MPLRTSSCILSLAFLSLSAAATCRGADSPAPEPITITGIVKPVPADAPEAATITANKLLYHIVKDAKGKIVARDAANKKAQIKGTLSQSHGALWLTVTWCALVE